MAKLSAASPTDINQLRYMVLLVEEHSVSRAAARAGISQPAMSAALRRMRSSFDDPVLVRSGHAMVATPRAQEMVAAAQPLLRSLQDLVRPAETFQARRSRQTFTLMGSDYVQFALLGQLCRMLAAEAPGAALAQRPANPGKIAIWMETGQVDLGVGYLPAPPQNLHARPLFSDEQVCIVRKGHPVLKRSFTPELFAQLVHVAVSPGGAGLYGARIDQVLQSLGIRRRVGLTLPSFLAMPYVVANTDWVATVPARIARHFSKLLDLEILGAPIKLPAFEISMFWHQRVHVDPANLWLRQRVIEASAHLRG